MKKMLQWGGRLFTGALLLVFGVLPAQAQNIEIDGVFFDWDPSHQIDVGDFAEKTFEEGDPHAPDANNPTFWLDLDVKDLFAVVGEDNLFIRVSMNDAANVYNTATDTSYHGGGQVVVYFDLDQSNETGLTWGWWANGYDAYVQVYPVPESGQLTVYEHTQDGNGWSWVPADTVGSTAAWNAGGNDVEVAVPLSVLREPKFLDKSRVTGDVAIVVLGSEPNGPWRADIAPSLDAVAGLPFSIAETGTSTEADGLPSNFRLLGNYPNPFNPGTTIRFELHQSSSVQVRVFDLLGRQVATLANGQYFAAGRHNVAFDARDLTSGVYLYQVETAFGVRSGTMTLLK